MSEDDDYIAAISNMLSDPEVSSFPCSFLTGVAGSGKGQPLTAKILTPTGWLTMGELQVGDIVSTPNGSCARVLEVFDRGEQDIYRVTFTDGATTECDADHLWLTMDEMERLFKRFPKVRVTAQMIDHVIAREDGRRNYTIPITKPTYSPEIDVYTPPYLLGVLLGDGHLGKSLSYTKNDPELAERIRAILPPEIVLIKRDYEALRADTYGFVKADGQRGAGNLLIEDLREMGLLGKLSPQKFIPTKYLFGSIEQRLELLRGLMDTDGGVEGATTWFYTTSEQLAYGVDHLVNSLGGIAKINPKLENFFQDGCGGKKQGLPSYNVSILLPNEINPFHLPRKRDAVMEKVKYFPSRYITSIEFIGRKPTRCIVVDSPEHLYITDNFIVTHNSYQVKQRAETGKLALCASTGIAAYNMGPGVTTIHSLLGFYDHDSLMEAFIAGRIQRKLYKLVEEEGINEVALDEVSMFGGPSLDLLYNAFDEVNKSPSVIKSGGLALTLVGDYMQLPPVKAPFAFEANCWPSFEANTTRLTKIWRQTDTKFLEALNFLRAGKGGPAAEILSGMGITFHKSIEPNYDGTTLMAHNEDVDRYNLIKLQSLPGKMFGLVSNRWGTPEVINPKTGKGPSEWDRIPDRVALKIGARVMILANDTEGWTYVNGSTGVVTGLAKGVDNSARVRIVLDDGLEVEIGRITRRVERKKLPDGYDRKEIATNSIMAAEQKKPYYRDSSKKYVLGEVTYYPLRLAWSSTIHRSQGLSLDRVQIDMARHFFGAPAMSYTSFSRCRTPEGLRIVGTPDLLIKRCNIDKKVLPWL